jgi:hypothetical protein
MLIGFVGDEVVEVLSVVRMVCAMPTDIPTDRRGGVEEVAVERNSDATIVRSSKLGRCLEMKILDLVDLASLPSGCTG